MIRLEHVAPSALTPAPYNPRTVSSEALGRLRRGIAEYGIVDPIIARREDGLVIGGHQRLRAAIDLGLSVVPVVYLDGVTDDRAAALNVLLNNPSAQGAWDMARLSDIVSSLDAHGFDATLTGFDDGELEKLLTWTGAADDGPAGPQLVGAVYQVVVTCATEHEQGTLVAELEARGLACRLLML